MFCGLEVGCGIEKSHGFRRRLRTASTWRRSLCHVGGVAVVLHGADRPVADLDIVVSSNPADSNRALQALLMAGFVPSVPLPLSMLTVLRMFDSSEREVDLFVNFVVPFNELFADSTEIPVGKTSARVASVPHLIRAKQATARSGDLQDAGRWIANEPEPS